MAIKDYMIIWIKEKKKEKNMKNKITLRIFHYGNLKLIVMMSEIIKINVS